jgi:hypothetical protein
MRFLWMNVALFLRQNRMEAAETQDFKEVWFPGVHADVGGGYREEDGGLWRGPFTWILEEACQAGLAVDPQRLDKVLTKTESSAKPWLDDKHESLTAAWWPAEFIPKLQQVPPVPPSHRRRLHMNRGRPRFIQQGACLHKTTLLRIRETAYAPPNLSKTFLDKVRALPDVPEMLLYEP